MTDPTPDPTAADTSRDPEDTPAAVSSPLARLRAMRDKAVGESHVRFDHPFLDGVAVQYRFARTARLTQIGARFRNEKPAEQGLRANTALLIEHLDGIYLDGQLLVDDDDRPVTFGPALADALGLPPGSAHDVCCAFYVSDLATASAAAELVAASSGGEVRRASEAAQGE